MGPPSSGDAASVTAAPRPKAPTTIDQEVPFRRRVYIIRPLRSLHACHKRVTTLNQSTVFRSDCQIRTTDDESRTTSRVPRRPMNAGRYTEAMTDLAKLDAAISRYVRPATFPLAIRMVTADEQIPARTRRPHRDMDVQVTICQAIGISRRYGWAVEVTPDDLSCPLVFVPFGFSAPVTFQAEGHCVRGYLHGDGKAGAISEQIVPRLEHGKYTGILMAPLDRAEFEPQVVCVYGNSAQVMRLVQASLFSRGGALNNLSTGRIDCSRDHYPHAAHPAAAIHLAVLRVIVSSGLLTMTR